MITIYIPLSGNCSAVEAKTISVEPKKSNAAAIVGTGTTHHLTRDKKSLCALNALSSSSESAAKAWFHGNIPQEAFLRSVRVCGMMKVVWISKSHPFTKQHTGEV